MPEARVSAHFLLRAAEELPARLVASMHHVAVEEVARRDAARLVAVNANPSSSSEPAHWDACEPERVAQVTFMFAPIAHTAAWSDPPDVDDFPYCWRAELLMLIRLWSELTTLASFSPSGRVLASLERNIPQPPSTGIRPPTRAVCGGRGHRTLPPPAAAVLVVSAKG